MKRGKKIRKGPKSFPMRNSMRVNWGGSRPRAGNPSDPLPETKGLPDSVEYWKKIWQRDNAAHPNTPPRVAVELKRMSVITDTHQEYYRIKISAQLSLLFKGNRFLFEEVNVEAGIISRSIIYPSREIALAAHGNSRITWIDVTKMGEGEQETG